MIGKSKCKMLKQIRAEIAKNNDIEYTISECTFQGSCKGTCPKCEAEVIYLEEQLARRKALGKAVCVAGISACMMTNFVQANGMENSQVLVQNNVAQSGNSSQSLLSSNIETTEATAMMDMSEQTFPPLPEGTALPATTVPPTEETFPPLPEGTALPATMVPSTSLPEQTFPPLPEGTALPATTTVPPTSTVTPTQIVVPTPTPTMIPTQTIPPTTMPSETSTPTVPPTIMPIESSTPAVPPTMMPSETSTPTVPPTMMPSETSTPSVSSTVTPTLTVSPLPTEQVPVVTSTEKPEADDAGVEEVYTVRFQANGGRDLSFSQLSRKEGETLKKLPSAERNGYLLKGWYTSKKYGTKVAKNTKIYKNMVLYAQWEKVKINNTVIQSAKAVGASEVELKWNKNKKADGYKIVYATDAKFKKNKNTVLVSKNKTSQTLSGLKKGSTYYFKVTAYQKDSTETKLFGKCKKVRKVVIK